MDTQKLIQLTAQEIDLQQQKHCVVCKHGKLLMKLKSLKEDLVRIEELQNESAERPAAPSPSPRAVSPKKGARKGSTEEKLQAVLNYVSMHPNCKIKDIAAATGYNISVIKRLLAELKSLKHVESIGNTSSTVYRATERSKGPENSGAVNSVTCDLIQCPMCHAACSSQARLDSHMRMVHPAASV